MLLEGGLHHRRTADTTGGLENAAATASKAVQIRPKQKTLRSLRNGGMDSTLKMTQVAIHVMPWTSITVAFSVAMVSSYIEQHLPLQIYWVQESHLLTGKPSAIHPMIEKNAAFDDLHTGNSIHL